MYEGNVTVTRDIYTPSKQRRIVEAGAKGFIVSRHLGDVGILFDDDGKFVELDGSGQRLQQVPYLYVEQSFTDKPCAVSGLVSYRYRGRFGYIMIGATDEEDALREARRSTELAVSREYLEVWDTEATRYKPVS